MKSVLIILSFYLSFYTLGIAAIPCSGIVFEEEKTTCCADDCSNDEKDSEDGCKVCNPFFSCACYSSGIIFTQTSSFLSETIVVPATRYTAYISPEYIEPSHSVWQPPKLSA